jgi:hypothetical protein
MDLDAIAAPFRRTWTTTPAANAAPDGAASQASSPAGRLPAGDAAPVPLEAPWLTAEAYGAPVTTPAPGLYSNTQGAAGPPPDVAPSPTRRAAGRAPRRRRWAMPGSSAKRRADPADPPPTGPYPCPHCGRNHQPVRLGGGLAALAGRSVLPEPGQRRPPPLGREPGDTSSLVRDSFQPWSTSPAAEPRPRTPLTLRERVARLLYGDEA